MAGSVAAATLKPSQIERDLVKIRPAVVCHRAARVDETSFASMESASREPAGSADPEGRRGVSAGIGKASADMKEQIFDILGEVLGLDRGKHALDVDTRLLGSMPEFDSMAVVSILTAIEDQFGISIGDDEVDAAIFESAGTLIAFVEGKTGAHS